MVESVRGWLVVAAAFLSNVVAFGITYSFGVMFDGLSAEFGAGRGATATVFSFAMALHFLLGFVTGPASDRHGPRALLLVGAAAMSTGLLLTSLAPTLWIAGLTYGVGIGVGTACTYVPTVCAVAGWFERRRPIALGIAVAGVGVGTLTVTPLVARFVSQHGVRFTCVIFGLATALVVPAVALLAHRPPRPACLAEDPPARVFQAPSFVRLYASAAGFTVGVFVPMVFLAPFAEHHGMSTLKAATLIGIVGGANAAGRLILGAMAARWDGLVLYRTCFLILGVGLVVWLLCHGRYDYLLGFALLLGTAHGGWTALLPAVTAQLYGTRGLGRVLGTLHTGGGFGCLVGPPVAGAVIDLTGGYGAAIALSAAMVVGSWALLRPLELGRCKRSEMHREERGDHAAALPIDEENVMKTALRGRFALGAFIRALVVERRLRRVVCELESLDEHRLRDLGLTRANIERAVRFGRASDAAVQREQRGSDHAAAA
jgi:MFS family permease